MEKKKKYTILVGKPERKRQLWIPRFGWKDIIKWVLKKQGSAAWTGLNLAQDSDR